jgi:hypothetical protein
MPFQQRTNTSCQLALPTHGFTVVLSVFRGTPPPKPSKCKLCSNPIGALFSNLRAKPTGKEFCILCAIFSLVLPDIIETSPSFRSQSVRLLFMPFIFLSFRRKNKKPCLHAVSKVIESLFRFFTCLPQFYPNSFRGFARHKTWIDQG